MTKLFVVLFLAIGLCRGLENTQTSVSKSLVECYNDPNYYNKDSKLPMTIDTFLDIIRKVEDSPYSTDLMQLSAGILQRFRQDGIIQAVGLNIPGNMPGVLRFSPSGWQNDKFKMVLKYMIPPQGNFPNDTLTRMERCSLHSMISSSIEEWERKDEASVCPNLAKYQKRIQKRFAKMRTPEDVEIIHEDLMNVNKGNIKDQTSQSKLAPKGLNPDAEKFARTKLPKSECPVENGVIYTRWGAIAAGPLLSGIAAAAQFQEISLSQFNDDIKNDMKINNIWGATCAGDVAEAALYFNEDDDDDEINRKVSVGAGGGWNSTISPKWYFLRKKSQLYMTDAEIRGCLDGLILGKFYKDEVQGKFSSMRLSTLIETYYSDAGFGEVKACARRDLFKKYAPLEEMKQQATAFAIALSKRVILRVTLEEEAIGNYTEEASKSLEEYIPPNLQDVSCMSAYSADGIDSSEAYTDLILIVDFNWAFKEIANIMTYILKELQVTKWNANYTIVNGFDGSIVTNSTNNRLDFQTVFNNQSYYESLPKGFDLNKAIRITEELAKMQMKNEADRGTGGGRSMTAVFVPDSDPDVTTYAVQRVRDYINIFVPDLKLLAVTKGNPEKYANIVKDQTKDVIVYQPSSNDESISQNLKPLIEVIKGVPRRLINPKCGPTWDASGNEQIILDQYASAESINFYRLHPNYFFGEGSRSVKIKSASPSQSLSVCVSRSNIRPRANQTASGTSGDVSCETVSGKEYVYTLNNPCADKSFIHDCSPLYFSVEIPKSTLENMFTCTDDKFCRRPSNVKYTITADNLKCQSAGTMLITNLFLIVTMLFIKFF